MEKTAVVLAGGGSRGAYQIGVWRALRELGIQFQIVTGTSVGALNGALMVQGDYETASALWGNLTPKDVVTGMFGEQEELDAQKAWVAFVKEAVEKGGADVAPLERTVASLVNEEKFRRSEIEFALVTVQYPSFKPCEIKKEEIPEGMLTEYLLASAACFPYFKTKEINGIQYIDGGYHDNLPINLALDLGAEQIIAVDLDSVGLIRKIKQPYKKIVYIRSQWNLGSFLLFDTDQEARNMKLGYLDAMKALGKMDGYLYAFPQGDCMEHTKEIHASALELLELANKRDPKLTGALSAMMTRRMLRDFRGKTLERRPFTISRQIILAAEYCGECFHLDPTRVYPFREFNECILNGFQQAESAAEPIAALTDLPKMAEELRKLDRAALALLIYGRLYEFLYQKKKGTELLLLAATFWKEFLAAVYFCILRNLLPAFRPDSSLPIIE